MNNAVGYIRVSKEKLKEGLSPDMQKEKIESYCKMAGLELKQIFIDNGISGSTPIKNRKEGKKMLEAIKALGVTDIVAYKLDRLFRNASDCLHMTAEWDQLGIHLHLIDLGGQTLNTGSPTGKFFLTTLAALAELERDLCSERIQDQKKYERSKNKWQGGILPLGYMIKDGIVEISGKEAQLVERIYQLKSKNRTEKEISSITGVPKGSINKILNNPTYKGLTSGIPAIIKE